MTASLKYTPGILYFNSQLKFPEDDIFKVPGILEISFKKMGFLKYKPVILNCCCHHNFPEEDVY